KIELRVDHRRRTIDVHRDAAAILALESRLDRARDPGKLAGDRACCGRLVDELEQARRARIERGEGVGGARNDLAGRGAGGGGAGVDGCRLGLARLDASLDVQE